MKIATCARMGVLAVLAMLVLSGTGWATVVPTRVGPLDFCEAAEYTDNFVEVRRGPEISPGTCAVNFSGLTGAAGDTWITRYNGAGIDNIFNGYDGICMSADVLISKYNNAKGGGVVALLNTDPGDKGLFLLLINNGNTDRLTLNTIDPNNGKIVQLSSVPLGSAIVENAWYRLSMTLGARSSTDGLSVSATVHSLPAGGLLGALGFNGSLQAVGLEQSGYAGMAAWAKSAVVDTSITNFFAVAPCLD